MRQVHRSRLVNMETCLSMGPEALLRIRMAISSNLALPPGAMINRMISGMISHTINPETNPTINLTTNLLARVEDRPAASQATEGIRFSKPGSKAGRDESALSPALLAIVSDCFLDPLPSAQPLTLT